MAQRVGRGIALVFHDRGTRTEWVVSSTPRPHFTSGKDPVPILQEVGWAPGPVWMGGKFRPHRDSIPDRPALSQSLYRLSYPTHVRVKYISQRDFYEQYFVNICRSECCRKTRRGRFSVNVFTPSASPDIPMYL